MVHSSWLMAQLLNSIYYYRNEPDPLLFDGSLYDIVNIETDEKEPKNKLRLI